VRNVRYGIDEELRMTRPTLPPEITVIRESLSVTRYILPKRDLGAARKAGWAPIVMGVLITIFMFFWMSGPISGGLRSAGTGRWIGIVFGLSGLPGLAAGVGLIVLGVAILNNGSHTEIVVGDGLIRLIDRIGFLRIPRKCFVSSVRRFVIRKGGLSVKNQNGETQTYAPDLAAIMAETTTGKQVLVALAYPHEVLRPLADVLAASLSAGGHSMMANETMPVIEVVEREAGEESADTVVPKPEKTDITIQTYQHGLAISVPPKGLRKGSQGLFGFSLLWNGFMAVFTVLMVKGHPPFPVYLFILGFWGIGILMMLCAINMAKRKVMIAVVNNVLACRVIGPFKTSEQKIRVDMISGVRVGPSGIEVNDRPVMELQIIPKAGKKIGLLSNRSSDEQEWLAYTLRQALNVGRG